MTNPKSEMTKLLMTHHVETERLFGRFPIAASVSTALENWKIADVSIATAAAALTEHQEAAVSLQDVRCEIAEVRHKLTTSAIIILRAQLDLVSAVRRAEQLSSAKILFLDASFVTRHGCLASSCSAPADWRPWHPQGERVEYRPDPREVPTYLSPSMANVSWLDLKNDQLSHPKGSDVSVAKRHREGFEASTEDTSLAKRPLSSRRFIAGLEDEDD